VEHVVTVCEVLSNVCEPASKHLVLLFACVHDMCGLVQCVKSVYSSHSHWFCLDGFMLEERH